MEEPRPQSAARNPPRPSLILYLTVAESALLGCCGREISKRAEKGYQNDSPEEYCWLISDAYTETYTFTSDGNKANKTKSFLVIMKRLKILGWFSHRAGSSPAPGIIVLAW